MAAAVEYAWSIRQLAHVFEFHVLAGQKENNNDGEAEDEVESFHVIQLEPGLLSNVFCHFMKPRELSLS